MLLTECPKLQPHDLDAEQAILGAILLDPPALSRAQEHLSASDFYDSRHRRIFETIIDLAGRGEGLDLLTIGNVLDSTGSMGMIGGRGTLAEWLSTVTSSSNISHHARIVRDHAVRRRLIQYTDDISRRAYAKSPLQTSSKMPNGICISWRRSEMRAVGVHWLRSSRKPWPTWTRCPNGVRRSLEFPPATGL